MNRAQGAGSGTLGMDGLGRLNLQMPTPNSEGLTDSVSPTSFAFPRQGSIDASYTPSIGRGEADPTVLAASQNILREDYLTFLEMELPRWKRGGLWQDPQLFKLPPRSSGYKSLEIAYSQVCQLDARMCDDIIRNRVSLIRLHLEYTNTFHTWKSQRQSQKNQSTGIGRGDSTLIIDAIHESIYPEWHTFDDRRRFELRAKFHDRKRYGKRWLSLMNAVGPSILLLCSTKVANVV